jgi:hypothetical protein
MADVRPTPRWIAVVDRVWFPAVIAGLIMMGAGTLPGWPGYVAWAAVALLAVAVLLSWPGTHGAKGKDRVGTDD